MACPGHPAETWGSQVAPLGNFKNKVNFHLQKMICCLEANDEVPSLEVLFHAVSLRRGQEENQIRVSVSTRTITVFILCFLNNPRLVTLKAHHHPQQWWSPRPAGRRRFSRLQQASPEQRQVAGKVPSPCKKLPGVETTRIQKQMNR